jgi:hypothetical protein
VRLRSCRFDGLQQLDVILVGQLRIDAAHDVNLVIGTSR